MDISGNASSSQIQNSEIAGYVRSVTMEASDRSVQITRDERSVTVPEDPRSVIASS